MKSKPDQSKRFLQKRCIFNIVLISILSAVGFLLLRFEQSPWFMASIFGLGDYETHVIINSFFFLVIPLFYLASLRLPFYLTTEKGLNKKNILISLGQGCGVHLFVFFPWFGYFVFHGLKSGFISWYAAPDQGVILFILVVALNVTTVEYFTKSFVQLQIEEVFNKEIGFFVQFLYWCAAHILEYLWIVEYTGVFHAVAIIVVSGLITGYLVTETENIFGVTIGHILLNILGMFLAMYYY